MSGTQMAIPILMYHSISSHTSKNFGKWAVSPELFDAHMRHLSQEGYRSLTISELHDAWRAGAVPERVVAITFDDAYEDYFLEALPILESYSFKATLYVATNFIGGTARWLDVEGEGDRPLMSWDQVRAAAARGTECGAHTHNHVMLDLVTPSLALEEIDGSRTLLEAELGARVRSFAYPYGYTTPAVRRMVGTLGFETACATWPGLFGTGDDPLDLPRLTVVGGMQLGDFATMVGGTEARPSPLFKWAKAYAWRQARRLQQAWRSGVSAP